jgi:steroid delta-isomerase-like uncharacterized protein
MTARYEEIVRRVVEEIYNKGNLEVVDEVYSPNFRLHTPMGTFEGQDGIRQYVRMFREALPDMHLEVDNQLHGDNQIALEWSSTGTHNGPLMGIEPTGKHVENQGSNFVQLDDDGKIVEEHLYWDHLGMLRKLDVSGDQLSGMI